MYSVLIPKGIEQYDSLFITYLHLIKNFKSRKELKHTLQKNKWFMNIMWQCCTSNDDALVNTIEKEKCENILGTTAAIKNDDFVDSPSTARDLDTRKLQRHELKKFHKDFKELIKGYKINWYSSEYIDMSQPRDAQYQKLRSTERIGKDVQLTSRNKYEKKISSKFCDPYGYRSMPTEVRGITLRQLRAIIPLIKRRCEREQWTRPVYKKGIETTEKEKVTLENATMYDINKYIIKPFTEFSQKSFVETLPSTKGTQPPRWFVR